MTPDTSMVKVVYVAIDLDITENNLRLTCTKILTVKLLVGPWTLTNAPQVITQIRTGDEMTRCRMTLPVLF